MNDKSTQMTIQSLDKGLMLLELIEESRTPLSLQDIWLKLKWNKATIYRMLNTFQMRGYLIKNPASKTYTLGIKVLSLYNSFLSSFDIPQMVKPFLQRIVEETSEEAHIAVALDKRIVFIDRIKSPRMISTNSEIGLSMPLHATALGKVYLAYLDPELAMEKLDLPLKKYSKNTITDIDELLNSFKEIRRNGYALDNGEFEDDMRCIAAPVFKASKTPFAMIGISGLHSNLTPEICQKHGKFIRDISIEISSHIGFGG